ncbi:class I SAM-dependent methyltransferase [Aneurinibacillus sp. REN35]|uniref:class I SAM-dependent methyltransferase n=1 Tax=Aneurinibacillus sp. REN35 TaxID=3237286 RepID=UPI003527A1E9
MFSSYSELAAEVYDIDKPIGHSFGDVEFYRERLKNCTGKILEPAAGTGRMLIPLLEAGLDVEGFDNSPEMMEKCYARCSERGFYPTLHNTTMQSFSLPRLYEAIIVPAGSFLLLEKRSEAIDALTRFYKHLAPGGRVIMDLFLPSTFQIGTTTTKTWTTPQNDIITLESKLIDVDYLTQHSVSYLRYEKWRKGKLLQTELQRFPLAWYGIEEFTLLLEKIGFSSIIVSADYNYGSKPIAANQTITFEAYR